MQQITRILVVPRWSGRPLDDWYPALRERLAAAFPTGGPTLDVLDMPHPDAPTIAAYVGTLQSALGSDTASTLLVGHSVGAQTVLRTLATLPAGKQVAGAVLVAGWLWVDEPWDTILPWIDEPFARTAARAATPYLDVLLSPTDRFTSDVTANADAWKTGFDAQVQVLAGADHFNGHAEPALLDALLFRAGVVS